MVKNLPAMQETPVQSLGWEDPLEKEMVTHSSTLAWKIPWTKEPGGLWSIGSPRVGHDWVTNTHIYRHTCMCVCMYIHTYSCIHTHLHTHTLHTHTHTYTHPILLPLAYKNSAEKSVYNLIEVPLYVMTHFFLIALKTLTFDSLIIMCLSVDFFGFTIVGIRWIS